MVTMCITCQGFEFSKNNNQSAKYGGFGNGFVAIRELKPRVICHFISLWPPSMTMLLCHE